MEEINKWKVIIWLWKCEKLPQSQQGNLKDKPLNLEKNMKNKWLIQNIYIKTI